MRWQTATADYTGMLCWDCMRKPLPEIIACFAAGPGGTVDGKDRGPYMIARETPGDDEGAAPEGTAP